MPIAILQAYMTAHYRCNTTFLLLSTFVAALHADDHLEFIASARFIPPVPSKVKHLINLSNNYAKKSKRQ